MYAGVSFRVTNFFESYLIDSIHSVDERAARFAVHALRVAEIKHRLPLGTEGDARILVRKESTAPQLWSDGLQVRAGQRRRVKHDKRGQIFVHAAESVGKPCT